MFETTFGGGFIVNNCKEEIKKWFVDNKARIKLNLMKENHAYGIIEGIKYLF